MTSQIPAALLVDYECHRKISVNRRTFYQKEVLEAEIRFGYQWSQKCFSVRFLSGLGIVLQNCSQIYLKTSNYQPDAVFLKKENLWQN